MQRKINFNAGPAALPATVLQQAADAISEYNSTGLSILELPHRGKEFLSIIEESTALVKELCGLGDDHEVLWLHGGGRQQFCMVPANFLSAGGCAGYIDSGHWAAEAAAYARHYGPARILSSSKDNKYSHLPEWPAVIPPETSYVHFTTNNTIEGTQWQVIPRVDVPLIADMSSDIFSQMRDYSKYSLFYAAAQKNLGVAGTALAVVRKDMIGRIPDSIPPMLSYKEQVKKRSILNTSNVFGVYISLLMLRWIKQKGIVNIEADNKAKASLLYSALDSSALFRPQVTVKEHRSYMNVCFSASSAEVEHTFLALCDENNITGIKGHRSVGGFRVSLYNCITVDEVKVLVDLMKHLETKF